MSSIDCSLCSGSGKSAMRGRIEKKDCRRCNGSGKSPDPDIEKELVAFLRFKNISLISRAIPGIGTKTGSFSTYK